MATTSWPTGTWWCASGTTVSSPSGSPWRTFVPSVSRTSAYSVPSVLTTTSRTCGSASRGDVAAPTCAPRRCTASRRLGRVVVQEPVHDLLHRSEQRQRHDRRHCRGECGRHRQHAADDGASAAEDDQDQSPVDDQVEIPEPPSHGRPGDREGKRQHRDRDDHVAGAREHESGHEHQDGEQRAREHPVDLLALVAAGGPQPQCEGHQGRDRAHEHGRQRDREQHPGAVHADRVGQVRVAIRRRVVLLVVRRECPGKGDQCGPDGGDRDQRLAEPPVGATGREEEQQDRRHQHVAGHPRPAGEPERPAGHPGPVVEGPVGEHAHRGGEGVAEADEQHHPAHGELWPAGREETAEPAVRDPCAHPAEQLVDLGAIGVVDGKVDRDHQCERDTQQPAGGGRSRDHPGSHGAFILPAGASRGSGFGVPVRDRDIGQMSGGTSAAGQFWS